jgi:hypothetical protein
VASLRTDRWLGTWSRVPTPALRASRLHDLPQAALGWADSYLHQFVGGDRTRGAANPDWGD